MLEHNPYDEVAHIVVPADEKHGVKLCDRFNQYKRLKSPSKEKFCDIPIPNLMPSDYFLDFLYIKHPKI